MNKGPKPIYGGCKTRTYRAWRNMLSRCYYRNNIMYHRYGGRGIKVCEKWIRSYATFYQDMGPVPDLCSLDRINNDGNYEPNNCRWANKKLQDNNRITSLIIEFNGKRQTLQQWSDELGINAATLHSRIKIQGWPFNKALTTPLTDRWHGYGTIKKQRKIYA